MIEKQIGNTSCVNFACESTAKMLKHMSLILKSEYDTDTRQLTVYCVDGSIFRLQMVQIN